MKKPTHLMHIMGSQLFSISGKKESSFVSHTLSPLPLFLLLLRVKREKKREVFSV